MKANKVDFISPPRQPSLTAIGGPKSVEHHSDSCDEMGQLVSSLFWLAPLVYLVGRISHYLIGRTVNPATMEIDSDEQEQSQLFDSTLSKYKGLIPLELH